MRFVPVLLLLVAGAACTETPTDIPPCVLPSDGCPIPDAAGSEDAGDAGAWDGLAVITPDGGLAE